jgi:A/G-specific adenine glycosylase
MNENKIQTLIMDWFSLNGRDLPWRKNQDPYRIWVSEIMLQQTRVEAVIDYFNRLINRLPTVFDLANVDDEVLYKLWQGLGYYTRAKNLKKAAGIIIEQYSGVIPNTFSELLKLPGIGPYTAGAIASIAFLQPVVAIDGNVQRVISRIYGNMLDITTKEAKEAITKMVESLLPINQTGVFNQALMEIGATICIPNGKPNCAVCPVKEDCFAFLNQKTNEIPVKSKKKARLIQPLTVLLVKVKNGWLLHKRTNKGLLANLWEFPNLAKNASMQEVNDYLSNLSIQATNIEPTKDAKHVFTHIEWHMKTFMIDGNLSDELPNNFQIVTNKQIKEDFSIASAFSHCLRMIDEIK